VADCSFAVCAKRGMIDASFLGTAMTRAVDIGGDR